MESVDSLWIIFKSMTDDYRKFGPVYCIIDGIDECDVGSRKFLLERIKHLVHDIARSSHADSHIWVIFTSRPYLDIGHVLGTVHHIAMDRLEGAKQSLIQEDIRRDVEKFVEVKLTELARSHDYPDALERMVRRKFEKSAQGSFLWIGFVAKALETVEIKDVANFIDSVPADLKALYDQMLKRVPEAKRDKICHILHLVATAARPLTLSELSVLLGVSGVPSSGLTRERMMKEDVQSCGSILTIAKSQSVETITFVNMSAREYLLRDTEDEDPGLEVFRLSRVRKSLMSIEIAMASIRYLEECAAGMNDKTALDAWSKQQATPLQMAQFPFLDYASSYWPYHARQAEHIDHRCLDLSRPFFAEKSSARDLWLKAWAGRLRADIPDPFPLIHISAWLGIHSLVKKLVGSRHGGCFGILASKNAAKIEDGFGQTPLAWAAAGGHERTVRFLLREDLSSADTKDQRNGRTPLMSAAEGGFFEVVKILASTGSRNLDNDRDQRSWTALHFGRTKRQFRSSEDHT